MSLSGSPKNLFQKIFVIASGVAFLGMMLFPMLSIFQTPSPAPGQAGESAPTDKAKIAEIAKGYEKVLEREPDNPTALQGLVEARLQLQDLPGSIAPLEKLVKLYPEETRLKQLLDAIKKQVNQGQTPSPKP
jgi:cytochrome c-type biogenesis protein CcmH/NrfG